MDVVGNVFVADNNNYRIQKFTSAGTYITQWGGPGSGNGQFGFPVRVASDAGGTVYVVDNGNARVEAFTSDGAYITQWGTYGTATGKFANPIGIAVDRSGDTYVADTDNFRIQEFGPVPTSTTPTTWGHLKMLYRR